VKVPKHLPERRRLLAEFVAQYRAEHQLDAHAEAVLERLRASPDAAIAFAELLLKGNKWDVLLSDCITAESLKRTHKERIERVQRSQEKAATAAKHLRAVREYFRSERGSFRNASLTAPYFEEAADALGIIDNKIYYRNLHCGTFLHEVSREKNASAARSEGIGRLKESVLWLSGKPNHRHVRALAIAALGEEYVELKAIEKALGPRARRESRRTYTEPANAEPRFPHSGEEIRSSGGSAASEKEDTAPASQSEQRQHAADGINRQN
jgi:hypothetical protein